MVELRNVLVHIPNGTLLLHGDDPWIKLENGVATITVPIRADPWEAITVAEAFEMHSATMRYWNDIDPKGEMEEGELLTRSGRHGVQVSLGTDQFECAHNKSLQLSP